MRKIFVFAIGTIFFAMLFAGCEEQQIRSSADNKKSRLVGAENLQLKKEFQQCNNKLEKCSNKLEKCKNQLEECQLETETSIEKAKEGTDTLIEFVMNEMQKLAQENAELQEQIKELEKQ